MPGKSKNIYHRKDGRWEGRYIREYNSAGKALYYSVYGKTYDEVKTKLEKAESQLEQPKKPPVSSILKKYNVESTITGMTASYVMSIKSTSANPTQFYTYKKYIENYLEPFWRDSTIAQLSNERIQTFSNHLLDKNLSQKTVRAILSLMCSAVVKYICENIFEVNTNSN